MRPRTLVARSLVHYRRSHVAVVLGVATAAAVLGGALVVGDSVRASLVRTALQRLGRATHAVESTRFFREDLSADVAAQPGIATACPIVALDGVATHASSGRRASDVLVYGVDDRYWAFHGVEPAPLRDGREALLSEALAAELGAAAGDAILLRLPAAADIPGSSLFGRRDDPSRALRLTVTGVRTRSELGELSLRPRSSPVKAAFVPLGTLQRPLGRAGRANVVLVASQDPDARAEALAPALAEASTLDDLALRLRTLPDAGALQLETAGGLIDDALARRAAEIAGTRGFRASPTLVYLANTLSAGSREVPYSLVAALDDESLSRVAGRDVSTRPDGLPPIVLNAWAAARLGVRAGARVVLDYFLWREEGRLDSRRNEFEVVAVTPIEGLAADRELAPAYPGITDSLRLADWEPPFPIDLDRIGPEDEAYWDRYRTTPKAFVSLSVGQGLWGQREGRLTALRFTPASGSALDEARRGLADALLAELREDGIPGGATWSRPVVVPVRRAALEASRGSTDFGQYFAYFSFFLVAAGLLLAGLFFRLGLEQRLREVGLLEAVGFPARRLRRQYLSEGLALAAVGGLAGTLASGAYAALVLWGLRTLWADALGTQDLALHFRPRSAFLGALGAVVAAALAVAWTLRDLRRLPPRTLLAAALEPWVPSQRRRGFRVAALLAAAALAVAGASAAGAVSDTAGFFAAGGLLLASTLFLAHELLSGRPRQAAAVRGVAALGLRGASFRPGRSVFCVALVAAATFLIVAVGAFRHDEAVDVSRPDGASGGYRLLAWSMAPLHHDHASAEGQRELGLDPGELDGVEIVPFRARRGQDASCLNLYAPGEPTVLAASPSFVRERRFSFQSSLARTGEERGNPWLLLESEPVPGEPIPVVADASTLAYALHRRLGDEMTIGTTGVRVRFVAALAPGLLQGELVAGERSFAAAFPGSTGDSFFLLDAPEGRAEELSASLESRLVDFGFDATPTAARLRELHRVENTYIATFQALGALGLLLGSVGLASVLVRNALEQRGAIALLRAVGFRPRHLTRMVLAENATLVSLGFLAGAFPALVAVAPSLAGRGGGPPLVVAAGLLAALAATTALVTALAVALIRRMPLLESLRSQ
jgi:ABC-type antimicrobial peptide transport system permease subunit